MWNDLWNGGYKVKLKYKPSDYMGQYFQIHNLSKKQYFNASVFKENNKQSGILRGMHAFALGRLLTAGLAEGNPLWRPGNETGVYAGAWAGDRIAITGDYGQTDFFGVEPIYRIRSVK
jgi:hypothetical protein